jgi:hypothetical protein
MKIVQLNSDNIDDYGLHCISNPKNVGYIKKSEWLRKKFNEGLIFKVAYDESKKKVVGFIEYISGEKCYRGITASNYLVIHCLGNWTKSFTGKGIASGLLKDCIKFAKQNKFDGICTVCSDGSFLTGKEIYYKNGFKLFEEIENFQLVGIEFKKSKKPKINDWKKSLSKVKGLKLFYAYQCNALVKSVNDIKQTSKDNGWNIKFIELKTAKEVQNAPSPFGVFCIVKDGEMLCDRYCSLGKFKGIAKRLGLKI